MRDQNNVTSNVLSSLSTVTTPKSSSNMADHSSMSSNLFSCYSSNIETNFNLQPTAPVAFNCINRFS